MTAIVIAAVAIALAALVAVFIRAERTEAQGEAEEAGAIKAAVDEAQAWDNNPNLADAAHTDGASNA